MYNQIQTNCDIAEMANQPYSAAQKTQLCLHFSFQNRNVLRGMQRMGCQARR